MARRSFSLMLAWRYLNPRRAMLSAVAIISMAGVAFGVFALVAAMSIFSGLEREVKERILGFVPHVRLDFAPDGGRPWPIEGWREICEEVAKVPGVVETGPFIQDTALIDIEGSRSAGFFRGIDSTNPKDVAGIEAMLDLDGHPGSSADMGLDDRVVISSKVAQMFRVGVGGKLRLLTMRNLQEVERVYDQARRPPVREESAALLAEVRAAVGRWKQGGGLLPKDDYNAIYAPLREIFESQPREAEQAIILRATDLLDVQTADDPLDAELLTVSKESADQLLAILAELDTTSVKEMNGDALMGIEQYVLPKEVEIIGVYSASQMALTPDVFVPLHMAQDLAGLDDGDFEDAVMGINIRLEDPYKAGLAAAKLRETLPPGWRPVTWIQELDYFSRLIEQQRVMMYLVLSLIVIVSAFSMTAVMFTVTIQKRREVGVMKALGAAPGQIVRVFAYQGIILGALGAVLGVAAGLLLVHFRGALQEALRQRGFDPFPASFNGFNVLPAHVNPAEVTTIAVAAFVLCAGAALFPAFLAARADAAKSLRNL